ncbi:MAG: S8 family serine peptidase [Vicinamibacterales bacterium]
MRHTRHIAGLRVIRLTVACLLGLLSAASGQAQEARRYMLRAADGLLETVLTRHSLIVVEVLRNDAEAPIVLVAVPASKTNVEIELEVEADLDVENFERDKRVDVAERTPSPLLNQSVGAVLEAFSTNTPVSYFGRTVPRSYAAQAAGRILRLPAAQAMATGNSVVAIIDTGVDANHPLLQGLVVPGYDFTRNLPGTVSDIADLDQSVGAVLEQSVGAVLEQLRIQQVNTSTSALLNQSVGAILESLPPAFGHGTMVAGLVHYVAPTARIMPLKAFRADGTSQLSDIVQAVYYAVDHGARVINMSFSMPEKSNELARALNYAQKFNAIPVAAAGNDGQTLVRFPAGDSHAIGAGSTTTLDTLSVFSNYGVSPVRLGTPGEAVVTSFPGGFYAAVSGTSFSTALLSGAVALQVQVFRKLSLSHAITDLSQDAVPVSGLGAGRVDLPKALNSSSRRR